MTQRMTAKVTRQSRVAHWAHNTVSGVYGPTCVLDTETTDFNGEIIDCAVIDLEGNILFNELIRPQGRISEGASRVNGISEEMLVDKPTFLLVWPQLFEILSKFERIVTYNAKFDAERLIHTGLVNKLRIHCMYGKSIWPPHDTQFRVPGLWMCLMEQYAEYWGEWRRFGGGMKWQPLRTACSQQRIEHDKWHRALGDAEAALKLLQCLAAKWGEE